MEPEGIHELTAAYALEALDSHQSEEFDEHLRHCPQCRDELVQLHEAAAAMAYAAPPASPAEGLRARILGQARVERAKVLPFNRRYLPRPGVLAAATAVAAAAAVALGIWAVTLDRDLNRERSARAHDARALAVLRSARREGSRPRRPRRSLWRLHAGDAHRLHNAESTQTGQHAIDDDDDR